MSKATTNHPDLRSMAPTGSVTPIITGDVMISGRHYVTPERLARTLGVTVRTLCRWHAARIGPRRIKVGKTVLFDVVKLPEWLALRESEPVRAAGSRR